MGETFTEVLPFLKVQTLAGTFVDLRIAADSEDSGDKPTSAGIAEHGPDNGTAGQYTSLLSDITT